MEACLAGSREQVSLLRERSDASLRLVVLVVVDEGKRESVVQRPWLTAWRSAASGARGGRAASGTKSQRKAPATQEDLDKELEGFMGRDAVR